MTFRLSAILLCVCLSSCAGGGRPPQPKAVIRKSPFLREESGAYVKDLSDSYLARITPETKNVKSILGNQFVEEENHNTVRPAKYFRDSPPDTLLGDRKVPLSRIRYFMGLRDGKLRIGKIDDFDDDDEVVPVWNKTALVRRMESRAPYEQRDSAYAAFIKYDDLHDATSNPAYKAPRHTTTTSPAAPTSIRPRATARSTCRLMATSSRACSCRRAATPCSSTTLRTSRAHRGTW